MAVLGVASFVVNSIIMKQNELSRKVINVALASVVVSFIGVVSILINGTNDLSYASYCVSFIVWLSSAYFVVTCIRTIHGKMSVRLLCNYLIAVAITQCVLAILLDLLPVFKNIVNSFVVGFASMWSAGEGLERAGRLYGIGAALDVAGTRFCAILAIIGILVHDAYIQKKIKLQLFYVFLMVLLLVIGSMISRTTGLGILFVVMYFIIMSRHRINGRFLMPIVCLIAALVSIIVILYNNSPFFNDNLRFAFEGFFNYFESGEWRLNSTDTLKDMYVFPESLKTWVIGDGYFDEPYVVDPYYVGPPRNWGLFYMGTDVGYIRFIFYFGVLGLLSFVSYFIIITYNCISDFPKSKWIFIAIMSMNFLIWFKVATDIFCIFALFLCISKEDNDAYEKQYENPISDSLDI